MPLVRRKACALSRTLYSYLIFLQLGTVGLLPLAKILFLVLSYHDCYDEELYVGIRTYT